MRALIVNADDFGLSTGVSRGIVEAHAGGVLTSASLLVNLPGFQEAVGLARDNPRLGVGIHLNLVRGRPVLEPAALPTLVDAAGRFHPAPRLARRLLLGRVSEAEMEAELDAQVSRAVAAGLRPTHLDTEKHVHVFPGVLRALLGTARRHGIGQLRWGREPLGPEALLSRQGWKALALVLLSRASDPMVRASGLRHADHFAGLLHSGRASTETFLGILRALREGVTELACHPGRVDAGLLALAPELGPSYLNPHREDELRALLDPRFAAACREGGVRLVHYGELPALRAA